MEEQTDGYASDLTEEQWKVLEPLIGVKTGAGRPLIDESVEIHTIEEGASSDATRPASEDACSELDELYLCSL